MSMMYLEPELENLKNKTWSRRFNHKFYGIILESTNCIQIKASKSLFYCLLSGTKYCQKVCIILK